MFRHYLIASYTLFFCGSLCAAELHGKVIRIIDGDTLEVLQVNKTVRVRLVNIDAPEKKQSSGSWSTSHLKTLIAGQPVTVTYTQTDNYGRVLGRVVTESNIEVNRYMVQSGAAWVYDRYNTDRALVDLQRNAREQKLGLWAESNPVPPWVWRHNN